jgi:hypothetical protein
LAWLIGQAILDWSGQLSKVGDHNGVCSEKVVALAPAVDGISGLSPVFARTGGRQANTGVSPLD